MIDKTHKRLVVRSDIVNSQNDSSAVSILKTSLYVDIVVGIFSLDFDQLKQASEFVYLDKIPLVRPTT
jgi:hypothetical protein